MSEQQFKVYVLSGRGERDYSDCVTELAKVNAQVEVLPFIGGEDELIARAQDADGLIISSFPTTRTEVYDAPALRA